MTTIVYFILFIFLVFLICYLIWKKNNTLPELTTIKTINGNEYIVQNRTDSIEAAETLDEINKRILILREYLWKIKDSDESKPFIKYIDRLNKKYSYKSISEGVFSVKTTSYSINKKEIVFCLRERKINEDGETIEGNIEDINILMMVTLHELTHALADSYVSESEHVTNHEFMPLFKFLVKMSSRCGIYIDQDYKINPTSYCGMRINSNI